jgi:predicted MFS family arabinose efflux permease
MADYSMIFFIALALNVVVTFRSSALWTKFCGSAAKDENTNKELDKAHQSLLRKYMLVYLLATLSDWLQGPYVYALYDAYGYSQHEIAVLFVAGFGSSMVFGSFIGGMADWGGRRRFVVIFAITYAASCVTKRKLLHILCNQLNLN